MEFIDRVLKCNDCGAEFVFTAGEQLFFYDKQFKNDPKHCKQCKAKRVRGGPRVRAETRTTCSQCGAETTVPFKPTQGRPVLCRVCFKQQKTAAEQTQEDDAKRAAEAPPPPVVEEPSLLDTLETALLGPEAIPELG
jgi:CxxC-x17-CxxC domain-containing protein